VQGVELELSRANDFTDDALGVFLAGYLHADAVGVGLPGHRGLRHTELVNAVADFLLGALDRFRDVESEHRIGQFQFRRACCFKRTLVEG